MAMTEEYPAYLEEMEVGDERSLRARIDALTAELGVLSRALEDARRGKRILLIQGEELTNEVFVDVWKHAGGYEGRSRATTWLLSIAHNRAISALRKRREEPWDDETAAGLPDKADDSEVALQKADKGRHGAGCALERYGGAVLHPPVC